MLDMKNIVLKPVVRKAFGNVSLLWFSSLFGAGLAFFTHVVLSRKLAPASYGVFVTELAVVNIVSPLAGFGVQGLWLKLFGAEGGRALRWLPASFRFLLVSTLLVIVALFSWAIWGPHDELARRVIIRLIPVVVGTLFVELVGAKLQLEEKYESLAWWQTVSHSGRFLLVVLVILSSTSPGIDDVAAVYAVVALVIAFFGFFHLRDMFRGKFILKGHSNSVFKKEKISESKRSLTLFKIAQNAWPFGLSGIFYLIYFQSAIVLLKYFSGSAIAGVYNVALVFMTAVYLFPGVVYQKYLLPKFHRWANHDRAKFLQVYRIGNGSMLVIGLITMVMIIILTPFLIPILFGEEYRYAADLLKILSICVPIRFLATSVGATLVTQENILRKVGCMGAVTFLNIFLNLLMISRYSAEGAVAATLISEVSLLLLYLAAARRYVFGVEAWRGWVVGFKN